MLPLGAAWLVGACSSARLDYVGVPLPEGLFVRSEQIFYDINGTTAADLRTAMLTTGPRMSNWPLFGYTEWEVRWRLRPQVTRGRSRLAYQRGRCALQRAEVDLTIRTVLPRWTPPSEASRQLIEEWGGFFEALSIHEGGHKDLGVEAAREVLHNLRALRSLPCGSLVVEADTAAQRTLYRYRERNVEYDRVTTYGRAQGVLWPPATPDAPPPDLYLPPASP